ncbi:hypothetical protein Vafri_13750, partial [Volvox africanus]
DTWQVTRIAGLETFTTYHPDASHFSTGSIWQQSRQQLWGMGPKGLLLAGLLAGACAALQADTAKAQQGAQQVPSVPIVNVTVYVEGTVLVYVSHDHPKAAGGPNQVPPPMEITHTLIDKQADNTSTVEIRVDFGEQADSLVTGDLVVAPITLGLLANQAAQLGLGPNADTSPSGRRRLLSEEHEQARRMVLEFHETRRTLQETKTLIDLLRRLNVTSLSQTPKSNAPDVQLLTKNSDKDMFVSNGVPQSITSLAFIFKSSSCGVNPALNAEKAKQWWHDNGDNAPIVATLQRYYNVCSFNQIWFRPSQNLVFDVDIPCIGNTSAGKYDLKNGNGNGYNLDGELYGLPELAKRYLQNAYPDVFARWSSFRRKVFFFPFNWYKAYSGFAGLAMMGCAQNFDCYTWMHPGLLDNYVELGIAFQELGHNIGLAHSARTICNENGCVKDEYGDPTDPMGFTWVDVREKQLVCTNAPQAYKAGWSGLVDDLNGSDLKPGIPRSFVLPAMALKKENMLRIVMTTSNNWASGQGPVLFISFRVRQAGQGTYDSGLIDNWNNRVWIHEYNETNNGFTANYRTPPMVLAMITDDPKPPQISGWGTPMRSFTKWVPGVFGVNITVRSKTPQAATVSVCRFVSQAELACSDGIDNDCDGLVDSDDPDCNNDLKMPPPPQPQLRPPPPSPQPPRRPPPLLSRSPAKPPPIPTRAFPVAFSPPPSPSPRPSPPSPRPPPPSPRPPPRPSKWLRSPPPPKLQRAPLLRSPPSPPRPPRVPRPPGTPRPPRPPRGPSMPRPPRPPPRQTAGR